MTDQQQTDQQQPVRPERKRKNPITVALFWGLAVAVVLGTAGGAFVALGVSARLGSHAPHTAPASPTQVLSSAPPTTTAPATPVVSTCSSLVGQPTTSVIASATPTQIAIRCYTGSSVATDQTRAGSQACSTTTQSGQPSTVYYWASNDPANVDQNVYAGLAGGTVLIVPSETAKAFWSVSDGLDAVARATGCVLAPAS